MMKTFTDPKTFKTYGIDDLGNVYDIELLMDLKAQGITEDVALSRSKVIVTGNLPHS